jgi:hypothetical protein
MVRFPSYQGERVGGPFSRRRRNNLRLGVVLMEHMRNLSLVLAPMAVDSGLGVSSAFYVLSFVACVVVDSGCL